MATYTLKSKAYTDSGYTGNNNHRYFKLTYTTTKTSTPGETRVDWQFISAYEGASAGLNIYCKCTLKTKVEKGTLVRGTLPSYTQTTWKAVRFNNGGDSAEGVSSINKTGTFYVKHADDGEAKLAAEITNCAIYTQGTSLNRAATFTLTDNFPITQITAPTFFSAEGEIISNRVVRGENIVLNWSGEKEGVANAIAGYKIYYTISKDGTKPSINSNVISIEGIVSTYTFPVDKNAIRGNKIVFAIQVIGASGKAAYNSELQFSEAVTINVIPSSPQVTFSKNKLPNKGGTFGISFESEWPVEYSTKTNPNQWLKIAPPISPPVFLILLTELQ